MFVPGGAIHAENETVEAAADEQGKELAGSFPPRSTVNRDRKAFRYNRWLPPHHAKDRAGVRCLGPEARQAFHGCPASNDGWRAGEARQLAIFTASYLASFISRYTYIFI